MLKYLADTGMERIKVVENIDQVLRDIALMPDEWLNKYNKACFVSDDPEKLRGWAEMGMKHRSKKLNFD